LSPLFDKSASEVTVERIFEYSERIDEIEKLLNLLRPQLYDIQAHHCIDVLSPFLAEEEKYKMFLICFICVILAIALIMQVYFLLRIFKDLLFRAINLCLMHCCTLLHFAAESSRKK